jgi:3-oxoadipate enol-lactonase
MKGTAGFNVKCYMFKTSDDCPIAYTIHSARAAPSQGVPRMVLVHSLALDASIWDGAIARLAGRAEILTYDCRGHGRSGRQAMPFTTDLFARDLTELLDHVGWRSALVGGCSMGGCVAQAFAGQYPSRASGLALIDTTAWYGEDAAKAWRERASNAQSKGLAALVEFQTTRWFGDAFRAAHPEVVNAATRIFLANDLDCYAASCVMLGDADLRRFLPGLRIPVTIIVGEEDYATPVAAARQLHEGIPGSLLTILPKARHLTPMECPDQIASYLLALTERATSSHG